MRKSGTLRRDRIASALLEALGQSGLVVLTAPMGYGKTTAARAVFEMNRSRTLFMTMPQGPHTAMHVWGLGWRQIAAQGSAVAAVLQRAGFPRSAVEWARVLEQTRKALDGRPTVLVMDDYHHVESREVDSITEKLIRAQIPELSVLLLSRAVPDIHLQDMCVKGLAVHFQEDFLRFTREDIEGYLHLHGIRSDALTEEALRITEGWPAALWLSVQSYKKSGKFAAAKDVEDLLYTTVYRYYTREEKSVLLQLSQLESFTLEQADFICANENAKSHVMAFCNNNAFISYDKLNNSYRMHSLFRGLLLSILSEKVDQDAKSIEMTALYRRCGEHCRKNEDFIQAIRFFHKAGAPDDLLQILLIMAQPTDGTIVMLAPEEMLHTFQDIPWEIRLRCPIGYLAFVYYYLSRISVKKGMVLLEEAERRFMDSDLSAREKRRIRGELELMRGIGDFNDLLVMRDRHKTAHKLLDGRSSIAHRQLVWTFGSPHVAFLYLKNPGTYADTIKLVENDVRYYQDMTDGCSAGAQDLFRAEYLLETGALQKVEIHALKAAYKANAKSQTSTLIALSFTLARLYLALNGVDKPERALRVLRDLAPQVEAVDRPLLSASLDLCQGYIYACLGALEDVPGWIARGELESSHSFHLGTSFAHIVHGKALLVQKDYPGLEALSEEIPLRIARYNNLFALIHAETLGAIAALHLHGKNAAMAALERALSLARPDNIQLCVAEYGLHIMPLLRELEKARPADPHLRDIIRIARQFERHADRTDSLLSPRERDVIARVAKGWSNSEIAGDLGLQNVTIAQALTRIFRKLGAKNRTEAARKWMHKFQE